MRRVKAACSLRNACSADCQQASTTYQPTRWPAGAAAAVLDGERLVMEKNAGRCDSAEHTGGLLALLSAWRGKTVHGQTDDAVFASHADNLTANGNRRKICTLTNANWERARTAARRS